MHLVRPLSRLTALLGLALAFAAVTAAAQPVAAAQTEPERTVEILPVEGYLDPPAVGAIRDVVEQASGRGSHLVVIQLDSPGSLSADVRGLVSAIRGARVPVAVLVGPRGVEARAGGAAGLVLAAGHLPVMAPDATVGPLAPADLGNRAGAPGDPAALAAELIADDEALAAVRDARVGAQRAQQLGLIDLQAAGLEPLLVELDGRTVTTAAGEQTLRIRRDEISVRFHSLGLVRRLLHAATTPVFVYLLVVAGLAMLLFEVFQPGFGVAGLAGVVTLAVGGFGLVVLPVAWWALALVVLGLVLFAVDAAIAGFGPVTLAATAALGAGSWWLYDSPVIDLPWPVVAGTTAAALVFFVVVITVVLRAQAPPDEAAIEDLVGRPGIVRSMLNPEGHVYVDDALWRARWTGEGRRASVGTAVRVHGVDGPVVLVEAFDPDAVRDRDGSGAPGDAATGANSS